ncbi:MAG: sulfite exporter TauE/SafE family protein [Planctomycetes bacterium]|nr:sulfite exporter TauE/SafE family protein [Planctomycetota bacterium]
MTTLVVTVFLASLLGSLHCAGMCGAFVALCVGGAPAGSRQHVMTQGAYHGGRLVTYTLLGAAAGGLGAALDLTGAVFGLQRLALALAGVAMVGFGVVTLLRLNGVKLKRLGVPAPLTAVFSRGCAVVRDRPPVQRALTVGLLSTFLPCGWLYAFAVTAAGTGSATWGAVTMAVFWAGTLPVLVSLGVGVTAIAGPLRRFVPFAGAAALVIVGVIAIVGRFNVPAFAAGASGDEAVSVEDATARVRSLDSAEMPCCSEEPAP